jgi:riboflavin-specific deaminase-like protein
MIRRMHPSSPPTLPWSELRAAAHDRDLRPAARGPLRWREGPGWTHDVAAEDPHSAWLDLYLPVCNGGRAASFVVGHLGQSLDGFIATCTGDSNYVTGRENIRHLHRMRALCDAVIVGAGTAASDDPRLTTRLVEGASPLRVVLDPRRRLPNTLRIFSDGEARSLRVSSAPVDAGMLAPQTGPAAQHEELLLPATPHGGLDLHALLRALATRGCHRLFVEGGGGTVSAFLEAGLLDRLHIAVAPLIIGSGRPAIRLHEQQHLGDCLRPRARIFRMGEDVLYDFDLRDAARPRASAPEEDLVRVY